MLLFLLFFFWHGNRKRKTHQQQTTNGIQLAVVISGHGNTTSNRFSDQKHFWQRAANQCQRQPRFHRRQQQIISTKIEPIPTVIKILLRTWVSMRIQGNYGTEFHVFSTVAAFFFRFAAVRHCRVEFCLPSSRSTISFGRLLSVMNNFHLHENAMTTNDGIWYGFNDRD